MSSRQRPQGGLSFPPLMQSIRRAALFGWVLAWAALIGVSCTPRVSEVRVEPENEIVVPAAPRISLKPHHRSMREGMRRSFDRADEIIIGIYTGSYTDGPEDRAYYFDQFRVFNKDTWTWGPEMNALLPVLFQDIKPEIITAQEFKSLSVLDKAGICWDDYEGPRVVFLVEGIPTLVFLKQTFDEVEKASRRILVDTYPVTKECRAKDVFDLMLRERAGN
ncbi:MAG: hypothetical protein WAU81_04640 [Candidatus Aminicenantales bacterium]